MTLSLPHPTCSPSAIRISDSFSVLSNCFMPEPAGDEHYRSLILVATEELNGCHPPGSVLVVAFVPYAQEDSWRKNCLLQCLGAGRCARPLDAECGG